jgi:hypothetical protein
MRRVFFRIFLVRASRITAAFVWHASGRSAVAIQTAVAVQSAVAVQTAVAVQSAVVADDAALCLEGDALQYLAQPPASRKITPVECKLLLLQGTAFAPPPTSFIGTGTGTAVP